jgi:hypothetical protein
MSNASYEVYDANGNFHAGYDADCRAWSRKDALKWARLTAKHIHGLVHLKTSDSATKRVINNYSYAKHIKKANSKNRKNKK